MLRMFLFLTTCCFIICWTSYKEHNHDVVVNLFPIISSTCYQYCFTNLDKGEPREKRGMHSQNKVVLQRQLTWSCGLIN